MNMLRAIRCRIAKAGRPGERCEYCGRRIFLRFAVPTLLWDELPSAMEGRACPRCLAQALQRKGKRILWRALDVSAQPHARDMRSLEGYCKHCGRKKTVAFTVTPVVRDRIPEILRPEEYCIQCFDQALQMRGLAILWKGMGATTAPWPSPPIEEKEEKP